MSEGALYQEEPTILFSLWNSKGQPPAAVYPINQGITFFHRTPLPFSFQMRKLGTNFPYQSSSHCFLMGMQLMAESTANKRLLFSSNICINSRSYNAILCNILLSAWVKQLTFCYRQAGKAGIINVHHTSNSSAIILEESYTILEGNRYILEYMYCKH